MGQYFTSDYENYLTKLSGVAATLCNDAETMGYKADEAKKDIEKLSKYSGNSNWVEQGATEFNSSTINLYKVSAEAIKENIEKSLKPACIEIRDVLVPTLKDLKDEDEKLTKCIEDLNNLSEPIRYDSEGIETSAYTTYRLTKRKLDDTKYLSEEECKKLDKKVKASIDEIKNYDNSVIDVVVSTSTNTEAVDYSDNKNLLKYTDHDGRQYWVVNTKISVSDYAQYVQQAGVWQRYILGDQCMLLSQYYAVDMLRGSYTSQATMAAMQGSPATRMNKSVKSQNPDDILKFVYDETVAGRPTVLQVTQKKQGSRHLVTVVGFADTVKSWKDLTPENIFVLDCADGKAQNLTGHNRKLKAVGADALYQALGATDEFLQNEVYNNG